MRRRSRSFRQVCPFALLLAVASVSLMAAPAVTLTPVRVVDGPRDQSFPSSNGTHVVWTDAFEVDLFYMQLPDGAPKRVNPADTSGLFGSFVTGAPNVIVYGGGQGEDDIFFFDLATRASRKAPAAVSRAGTSEIVAVASKRYILFERDVWRQAIERDRHVLLLYDRREKTVRVLDRAGFDSDRYFMSTYAGMRFVVWSEWSKAQSTWRIHYWSAAGGERVQPQGQDRSQVAGVLDESTRELYYINARVGACGATFQRARLGSKDATVVLWDLPRDYDASWNISVAENPSTGNLDLYFDRWPCGTSEDADIYALPGVDTV